MPTVLVTGAGGSLAVNITAGLHRADDFRVVGTEANDYYRPLSNADETYGVPYATEDKEAYLDALGEIIAAEDVDAVIPANSWAIDIAVHECDRLDAATQLPSAEVTDLMHNKWRTYTVLSETDVPVPETELAETRADVEAAFARLDTDACWVRSAAIDSLRGAPGRSFSEPEAATCWIDTNDGWGRFTVGEYLPGRDCTWLGVFDNGELIASQCRERLDYAESANWGGGAPTASRTLADERVDNIGQRAVEALDSTPNGVYFTDMRGDDDGEFHVTEVNPGRIGTTSSAFYPQVGFNVPELLVALALDADPPTYPQHDVLEPGLYFVRQLDCGSAIYTEDDIDTDSLPG